MGFVKKIENFICEICGAKVKGTGYTNHCPNCLWSKHVDINIPGDRDNSCQGLMKPVRVEVKHGEYSLLHQCQRCGKVTKNKTAENDNFEKLIMLSKTGINT